MHASKLTKKRLLTYFLSACLLTALIVSIIIAPTWADETKYMGSGTGTGTTMYSVVNEDTSERIGTFCVHHNILGLDPEYERIQNDPAALAAYMGVSEDVLAQMRYAVTQMRTMYLTSTLAGVSRVDFVYDRALASFPLETLDTKTLGPSLTQKLLWFRLFLADPAEYIYPGVEGLFTQTEQDYFYGNGFAPLSLTDTADLVFTKPTEMAADENGFVGPFKLDWSADSAESLKQLNAGGEDKDTAPTFFINENDFYYPTASASDTASRLYEISLGQEFYIRVTHQGTYHLKLNPMHDIITGITNESIFTSEDKQPQYAVEFSRYNGDLTFSISGGSTPEDEEGFELVKEVAPYSGSKDGEYVKSTEVGLGAKGIFRMGVTNLNKNEKGLDLIFNGMKGSGTEEDPFRIYTPQQLANIGNDDYSFDSHYRLMNDMDLTEICELFTDPENGLFGWMPIGGDPDIGNVPFSGVFDGQGYTIRGLNIDATVSMQALFGYVADGGVVKNVCLDGAKVKSTASFNALLASVVVNSTLENCLVSNGESSTTNNTSGGIAAYVIDSNIIGCSLVDCKIGGTGVAMGGIAAQLYTQTGGPGCLISNCLSENTTFSGFTVNSNQYVGFIVGRYSELGKGSVTIQNCETRGGEMELTETHGGKTYRFGGIMGGAITFTSANASNLNIIGCKSDFDFNLVKTAEDPNYTNLFLGGILGYSGNYAYTTLRSCENNGDLSGTLADTATSYAYFVGGITGRITTYAATKIEDCVNTGNLLFNVPPNTNPFGEWCNVGGIISYPYRGNAVANITRCYSSGSLSGPSVGGISGAQYDGGGNVNNCVSLVSDVFGYNAARSNRVHTFSQASTKYSANNYALDSTTVKFQTGTGSGVAAVVPGTDPQAVHDGRHGASKTLAELKLQSSYEGLGWDFTDMWNMETGKDFPQLRNVGLQEDVCDITLTDGTRPCAKGVATAWVTDVYDGTQNLTNKDLLEDVSGSLQPLDADGKATVRYVAYEDTFHFYFITPELTEVREYPNVVKVNSKTDDAKIKTRKTILAHLEVEKFANEIRTHLNGSEFTLYQYAELGDYADDPVFFKKIIPEENKTIDLPVGSYLLKETVVPDGYIGDEYGWRIDFNGTNITVTPLNPDTEAQTSTVDWKRSSSATEQHITAVVMVINVGIEVQNPSLEIEKYKEDSRTEISGAEFTVYHTASGFTGLDYEAVRSLISDSTTSITGVIKPGSADESVLELTPGYYVVEETKAPQDYQRSNTLYLLSVLGDQITYLGHLTDSDDMLIASSFDEEENRLLMQIKNEPDEGLDDTRLIIQKLILNKSGTAQATEDDFAAVGSDIDKTFLFGITIRNEDDGTTYSGTLVYTKTGVNTLTFDNLPYGKYKLIEQCSLPFDRDGYKLEAKGGAAESWSYDFSSSTAVFELKKPASPADNKPDSQITLLLKNKLVPVGFSDLESKRNLFKLNGETAQAPYSAISISLRQADKTPYTEDVSFTLSHGGTDLRFDYDSTCATYRCNASGSTATIAVHNGATVIRGLTVAGDYTLTIDLPEDASGGIYPLSGTGEPTESLIIPVTLGTVYKLNATIDG